MSSILTWFEAKVKVNHTIKMFHFERRTHEQALGEASKHGRVISVKKADSQALIGNIEKLNLNVVSESHGDYLGGGVYEGDLKIDELLGLKKSERRKRINDSKKHKGKFRDDFD